jgi:HSP20 family protein
VAKNKNSKEHQANPDKQKQSSSHEKTSGRTDEITLRTHSPFTFMRRFTEEMDRLFEDFGFGRGWLAPPIESGLDRLGALANASWSPQVEVFERGNQLVVRTDLPGLTKDDIKVDLTDDAIVIHGERKSEREEDEQGYYRSERSYGSFYRQIPLPRGVNADNATAEFRNGVLEISMPAAKGAERKSRQIEIAGEGGAEKAKARAAGQR